MNPSSFSPPHPHPFGMLTPGRNWSAGSEYRFGFNGKESDAETYGEGNIYDYGFRIYNPRLGKFLSVDPLTKKYAYLTPYQFASNTPISGVDLDGLEFFYAADGIFLGRTGTNQEVRILNNNDVSNDVAIQGIKNFNSGQIDENVWYEKISSDTKSLGIDHSGFIKKSSTVYGESSHVFGINSREEVFAIASVHERNSLAYGASSEQAEIFRNTSNEGRNGTFMQTANSAVINSLTGGFDYSYGATQWDGQEQSEFDESENRGSVLYGKRQISIELHMNTQGWRISDEHYVSWKAAVGNKFKAPQEKYATGNYKGYTNKDKISLISTAQYGKTIFWKTLEGNQRINKPEKQE
ncbi:MAG: RHS repeat-associated core domain-containing protein [Saprospiraceae bacterium]|nr:RHS repeat-associated core domain-containing protein [Saprospiraceae bacterium]